MGLFSKLNNLWSQGDFWDKQENAKQAAQAKAEEERKKREAEARARAQAEAAAARKAQQEQQVRNQQAAAAKLVPNRTDTPQVKQPGATLSRPADVRKEQTNTIANSPYLTPEKKVAATAAVSETKSPSLLTKIIRIGRDSKVSEAQAAGNLGLAAARTGTGLVEGVTSLPSMVAHATDWISNKLTGNTGNSRITKGIDAATQTINRPIDAANEALDRTAKTVGGQGSYEAQQKLLNAGLIIPGAVAAATKIPQVGNIVAKSGEVLNGVKGTSQIDSVLNALSRGKYGKTVEAPTSNFVQPEAPVPQVTTPEVAPGVKSPNLAKIAQETPQPVPMDVPPVPQPVGAVPTGVSYGVPQIPTMQNMNPLLKKAPVAVPDEAAVLRGRKESLLAEREQLIADGASTKSIDAEIKNIDRQTAVSTAPPTKASVAQAEADARVAEALAKPQLKTAENPIPEAAPAKQLGNPAEIKTPEQVKTEKKVEMVKEAVSGKTELAKPTAAPTRQALQKGASENTTKSGKVSARWISAQRKAGADPLELRSAVEKVEGRKAPPAEIPTKPVATGGLPLSGEQGIGQGAETTGKLYSKTSKEINVEQGKRETARKGVSQLLEDISTRLESAKKGETALTPTERNAAEELRKRFPAGSTEHNMLSDVIGSVNQNAAQVLSTANRVMRETASEDEIVNRLIDRAVGKAKFSEEDLADLKSLTGRFVKSRDEFNKANEAYLSNPSDESLAAVKKAHENKMQANKEQKLSELRLVASKNGDKAARKEMYSLIDKLNKEADVWQMDMIDTSLLSTTGTWNANFINSSLGALEETLFGKPAAWVARKTTGADIGGGNAYNINSQRFGIRKLKQEFVSRTQLPSKNVAGSAINGLKNFVTTMNELGNTQIDAGAHAAVRAEYRNILKREYPDKFGGKMTAEAKKELDNMVEYNAVVDPRDLRQKYVDYGFKVQGMAATLGKAGKTKVAKFENQFASAISSAIQAGEKNPIPKGLADGIGKLTMRVTVGFPTIVVRSAGQGLRRVGGGVPTFIQASLTKDPVEKAMLIKQGIKEAGSGASMVGAGFAAGKSGLITGAYPTDKTTQDEWAKEGKSEWSIKINGSYYGLPRMLGPFAIPFLVGAQMGDSANSDGGVFNFDNIREVGNSVAKSLDATMPTSQISDNLKTLNDLTGMFSDDENERKKAEKSLVKFGGNAARIGLIPLSGMLNQIAQSTVGTQQDTSQYDNVFEGIINHVLSGVPVVNDNLPVKTSKDGTELKNTNPLARALGAQSTENVEGVKSNQQVVAANNDKVAPIVGDKEIYDLLEPDTQKLLNDATDAKKSKRLNDQNYETIYKGVSKTTEKLASDGKWDSYGKTLEMKLKTLESDKTKTEEEKSVVRRQVTQAKLMSEKKVDPKVYALYSNSAEKGGISSSDFRKMIDPESDQYDFETATALWELDKLFAENEVSDNTTGAIDPWKRQKYSMPEDKKKGGSGGGSGKNSIETDFGTVGSFGKPYATTTSQKYQKLQNPDSPLPNLTANSSKTNLQKKISVAKGVRL